MKTEIKMPQLGESIHEGTVSRWLKQPGDSVARYEALLEVAPRVQSSLRACRDAVLQQAIRAPARAELPGNGASLDRLS